MGALGVTFFCKNGHIVLDIPHHGVGYDTPKECQYCGSKKIRDVTEWGDPDYSGSDIVPMENTGCEPYTVDISIYDVSRLFARKKVPG